MKSLFIPFAAAAVMASGFIVSSCSGSSSCDSASCPGDVVVNNFEVREVLKTASRSYEVTMDSERFYLNVETSVQWPERFGDSNLKPLRDSILSIAYGVAPGMGVDDAIVSFVNDRKVFDAPATMVPVDSIAVRDDGTYYEIDCSARLMELTERTATYEVATYSYLGGAHPNYSVVPFTYDLLNGRVLTLDNMFNPGSRDALLDIIKEQLAMQEGVTVATLADADIFADRITVSPMVYLSRGSVVFHYNRYDIAPYAKGEVDVEVPSYVLSKYLTPGVDSLINQ